MAADDATRSEESASQSRGKGGLDKEKQPSSLAASPAEDIQSSTPAAAPRSGQPVSQTNESIPNREDDLTQAKTVIRGSSRVENSLKGYKPRQGSPAAVAKVLLGQHLNHFHLEKLIGGGGMGAVFRAHDDQLDRVVAIKVIPFVGNDPDLRRRFRNEAQSAAKLDHPKIARVFDVGSQGDWHYIVFEYIDGVNIRDLVAQQGVLSVDDAVFYTCQLSEAIQHASDRGIVHRDIKPSNVLITADAGVRLVDMGLARSANMDLSEDMTASGVTLGTFDYISPEQANDPRDADLRSDLYSLGCTLYFMLTGRPPFPGGTMLQKLLSHGNTPPPDIRDIRNDVSGSLQSVVEKMLAKRPADRYQTAHDLLADLKEVASRDALKRTQSLNPALVYQSRPWLILLEKHSPWVAAILLMLLVAGWMQLQSWTYRADVKVPQIISQQAAVETGESLTESVTDDESVVDQSVSTQSDSSNTGKLNDSVGADADASGAVGTIADVISPPTVGVDAEQSNQNGEDSLESNIESEFASGGSSESMTSPSQEAISELPPDSASATESVSIERDISVVRVVPSLKEQETESSEGVIETTDFEKALELANLYNTTSRIELAVPLVVCRGPVTLESDDLLITSAVGGTTVVFEPGNSAVMARSKMFSIASHPVVFEDLNFVWNVAEDDLDGGCLFELNPNELVRFTDCSITVNNSAYINEVYAFEVISDPNAVRSTDYQTEEKLPLVWLELNNAIVRGQMTMLHMDYATRLWLDWDNGLLAVSERMIDTAGALYPTEPGSEPIRMKFWRVTAHARKGICLMRVGVSGAYPVEIERLAHESVFWVDTGVPHFDLRGQSLSSVATPLKLQGASNAYITDAGKSDPMLRVLTSPDVRQVVSMAEIANRDAVWAADKSPRWNVDWEFEGLETIEFDQRSPANYRLIDSNSFGFDEKALPSLPGKVDFDGNNAPAELSN